MAPVAPVRTARGKRPRPPDQFELLARLARTASAELELRPMLQRITDTLHRELGFELVALVSIDLDQRTFRCEALSTALPTTIYVGYGRALGSGIVGRAASTGTTVLVSDAASVPEFVHTLPGGQSELAVPIRFGGQTVAVLNLESTRTGAFDGSVELIESVAAQLAGTIAAAQRLELLDRRAALLETVAQTLREALEAPDLPSLCDRLLQALGERLHLAEATILLESDLRDHLQVVAHQGASPHITWRGKLWPIAAGVVGRCFRSREPQWVGQISADTDYAHVNPRVQAEYAVPICFRDRVFGVLNLETEHPHLLGPLERVAVRALADQAGGALHLGLTNQRLNESIKRMQSQDNQLERTRESLKRAVGKLSRRQGQDARTGLPNRDSMLAWIRRETVALRRGGRAAALLVLEWPAAGIPEGVLGELEAQAAGLRGRVASLAQGRIVALLGGARSAELRQGFDALWTVMHGRWGASAAALSLVEAPVRIRNEDWLIQAESAASSPPTVRSFAATA